jgi:hypothetical protein
MQLIPYDDFRPTICNLRPSTRCVRAAEITQFTVGRLLRGRQLWEWIHRPARQCLHHLYALLISRPTHASMLHACTIFNQNVIGRWCTERTISMRRSLSLSASFLSYRIKHLSNVTANPAVYKIHLRIQSPSNRSSQRLILRQATRQQNQAINVHSSFT